MRAEVFTCAPLQEIPFGETVAVKACHIAMRARIANVYLCLKLPAGNFTSMVGHLVFDHITPSVSDREQINRHHLYSYHHKTCEDASYRMVNIFRQMLGMDTENTAPKILYLSLPIDYIHFNLTFAKIDEIPDIPIELLRQIQYQIIYDIVEEETEEDTNEQTNYSTPIQTTQLPYKLLNYSTTQLLNYSTTQLQRNKLLELFNARKTNSQLQ
jgi:hypothetical protein